jgi:hypothetical protein
MIIVCIDIDYLIGIPENTIFVIGNKKGKG